MTKRYYLKEYEEEYYIFDSEIVTEKELDTKIEYKGYKAFEDSLTGDEILKLLNNKNMEEKWRKTVTWWVK